MANTSGIRDKRTVKIWQQNVNKSHVCQHDLISSARLVRENFDIIALQEPSINQFGNSITSKDWFALYPTNHAAKPQETRSLILIRTDILTNNWKQIDADTGDITAIRIDSNWGALLIFNVYNDCDHDQNVEILANVSRQAEEAVRGIPREQIHTMWLGDFNRHHPHWDAPSDNRLFTASALDKAEILIRAVANAGLDLALPPRMPTHLHNVTKRWTRLDQVFLSDHSLDSIVICEARLKALRVKTDHAPIVTELDLAITRTTAKDIANFREVDWTTFKEELSARINSLGRATPITSQSSLSAECEKLTKAIQETIRAEVPTIELSPRAKRWWTKELTQLRREANKLGKRASKHRSRPAHPIHGEYEAAKRKYEREIEFCKRHHWRDWLEKANDPDIWTAHKYISAPSADGSKSRIPTLTRTQGEITVTANTNEEKSSLLAATFFPTGNLTDNNSSHNADDTQEIAEQICEMDRITKDQIRKHLAKLKPYKAPGPDGIPNVVLTKCADIILDRLYLIYEYMIDEGAFYEPWKQFTTVVLRKPGKAKYTVPKAYRPIALLNTMVKVLTAVTAEMMMYYAEEYNLLPAKHFGGRKRRTATDAIHLLVSDIKNAWRVGKVKAVLFLDIEGAFPNADNAQLLRNLTKRGIPKKMVTFVSAMLTNRSTTLRFDDHTSETITLNNGIGQGDPLSMALYQFYNADLLDIPKDKDESAIAYVDDAILTATAKTFEEAHDKLVSMMTRPGGAIEWTATHNSQFEYSKLALVDFAHPAKKTTRPPLTLPNVTVTPSESTKYLGVILDQGLNWKEQTAYAAGKGSKWTAQIRRVARPTWGLTPGAARRIYQGVAIPRVLYGIDIWCTPTQKNAKGKAKQGPTAAIAKLVTTQRAGALAITGGFRTSPTDSLNAHAALLPMHLKVGKAHHNAATRLATLPPKHPLHNHLRRAAKCQPKRHKTPLHHLAVSMNVSPDQIEEIPVVRENPAAGNYSSVKIIIPDNKEDSINTEARSEETVRVYTDGSSHSGRVGASAVLCRQGRPDRILRAHLGKDEHHTVYEAELVGILLGLHLIKMERKCGRVKCVIGADNQAAVQALHTELTSPGQHIAAECLKTAKQIFNIRRGRDFGLTIRWIAGHSGIQGNEKADIEAKRAAEGSSSDKLKLPRYLRKPLKKSISAIRQKHNKAANETWKEEWQASDRYKRLRAKDIVSPSSKKYLKLINDDSISRRTASLIYQLRVGHAPLNDYLHRFQKVDSPRCPACGEAKETAEHFIKHCPGYAHERWQLMRHFEASDPKFEDILSNPKAIIPLSDYLAATGRFKAVDNPRREGP
jgi:ribonuclease HI/endonuclease/exonuclease/phosphatase family metal-dependent hydrolase